MELPLTKGGAVPLYRQIAESIQYKIATGTIPPGTVLPTLREGSLAWQVNVHTVGRAYRELAERGLVKMHGRSGTRVVGSARNLSQRGRSNEVVGAFVARILLEARRDHGLDRRDLAELLDQWSADREPFVPTVHVLECSEDQCRNHADEIEARWDVRAVPRPLDDPGELPPGPVIATYFHYHEVRSLWPERRNDIRFVAIRPDPDLRRLLQARTIAPGEPILLCEFDEPKAQNTISELAVLMAPEQRRFQPAVVERAGELLDEGRSTAPILFPPRVWAALSEDERAHPRAVPLRFYFEPEELDALGATMGWCERAMEAVS